MKAIRFDGKLSMGDAPVPQRAPGEALVRVDLAGICNTDIEITRGYMGFTGILGHEFVGEVGECDDPTWVGRRVVGEINLPCGECERCARGLGKHCRHRTVLGIAGKDGAFAEFLTLPVANLHTVPEHVTDAQAVFAEPLAACFEMVERKLVDLDDRVCVLGDGKLGALAAAALATTGCDLTVIGRHRDKLDRIAALAPEARFFLAGESDDANEFDVVAECTGSAAGLGDAIALVRPRGVIFLKSTVHEGAPLSLAPVVVDEITIVGSRCGPFAPALAALAGGDMPVERLIDATFPAAEAEAAFDFAQRAGVMKVLLDFRT